MIEVSRPSEWKSFGLVALIFCCVWAARLVTVGGIRVTGDRLLGLAAVAVLTLLVIRDGLRWTPVHWALAAFTAVQLVTSLLAASTWPSGPRLVVIYVLGFACFALAADWAAAPERLLRGARFWISLGAVLGLVGAVLTIIANLRDAPIWGVGVSVERGSASTFAARVTFNEWNLYSSFLLVAFALALWAWRHDASDRGPFWVGFLPVGGIVLGLVFGITRAAWIAMAGLAAFWLWRRRPSLRQVCALVLVVVFGFALQATVVDASPLYYRVVQRIEQGSDRNMTIRMAINRATIDSWFERPLLGHGAGSINALDIPGAGRKPWNGNLVLFVLHDSGVVGLAALGGVIAVIVVMARRARPRSTTGAARVPLLAAGVALLWAYQFTHGLWLMFPYVYLGLLTASMERYQDA